ncbi:MAG: YabP/YqfC family sporulation protein [Oscillospiraceae bacterium]|nr:YabP/YqfC family sporulation protein [Oscillospiraceae bacterium]
MRTIKGLCEDLAERLQLPEEAISGAVKLTAVGDRRLLIEQHKGLLEYSGETIRVSTGRGQIVLHGANLEMDAMNQTELLVCGRLQSLEWE